MLYEHFCETFQAARIGVNAFDQSAVEECKMLARRYLGAGAA